MIPTTLLIYISLLLMIVPGHSLGFDWEYANTSIWLSSGAYCSSNVYLNRTYKGYSTGFMPTSIINDTKTDTQGYIGVMESQQSIYVVLRGSVSFQNWIEDFDAVMVPYIGSTSCVGCYVHEGFSWSWNQVASTTIGDVEALLKKYPKYKVVVTGHSLGGAMASLAAMALQERFNDAKVTTPIRLFTFGAPRFCNEEMAVYATDLLKDKNRVTHYRDMAPHCPPYLDYYHMGGEWYEDELHQIHACEGLEDNNCSSRWYYTTIEDHMMYLTLPLGCGSVSDGQLKSEMHP